MSLLALDGPQKSRPAPAPAACRTVGPLPRLPGGRTQQLLELACKVGDAAVGGLALVSAGGEVVDLYTRGLAEETAAQLVGSPQVQALVRHVLAQSGPAVLAHPEDSLAPAALAGPFLGMELNFPGCFGGVLFLGREPGRPPFAAREVETVTLLLAALEQRDLGEENHLFGQLRLLNRVAQTAAGNLDLGLILERSLGELDRPFPLHVTAVWLVDEGQENLLTLAATRSIPDSRSAGLGLIPGMQLSLNRTPFAGCLRDGQGMYVDFSDPAAGTPAPERRPGSVHLSQTLAARGATCFFAAPLRAGDQTVGFLQSVCTHAAGFTGEQIQLLYLVADLLGPAVSNCRLVRRLQATCEELRAAQEHLIRVEKMRALGELASGMAHDFNNSLCGVLGFLDLTLMDRALGSASRNYLESARTCALDAAQTVRRVQDFARIRKSEPNFQTLDVNDLLRQVVELTRPRWEGLNPARNAPVSVAVQAQAQARVSGCASELREVLTNLVFNAVDAMPQGGKLTLRSWSTGGEVFLAVEDSGTGMSPAVRQRLFEPFFTTKGERGNGLGLSIAFGIIQNHRGEISVQSEVGQGTVFTIRLPAVPEGGRRTWHDGSGPRASPSSPEPGPVPPGLRVLVVEDEEGVREFLERALKHLGHQPRLVGNGSQGLAAFSEGRFDLLITDFNLPGINGDELARAVASRSPRTPILLLTACVDHLAPEAPPPPGVRRVLAKPLALQDLANALAELFPRP